jgi:hypothetical protein
VYQMAVSFRLSARDVATTDAMLIVTEIFPQLKTL